MLLVINYVKTLVMSDNKSKRDERDRNRVSGEESYELAYLEKKFNITRAQVEEAIKVVGNSREKVEEYLTREHKP